MLDSPSGTVRNARSLTSRPFVAGALAALVQTGCLDSDPAGAPSVGAGGFSETDSAGVQIVMSGEGVATTPLEWEVAPVPDLVLGEGPSVGEAFAEISGVRQLPNGDVLVLDEGSRELRFFRDGALVERRGQRGEGPEDFERPRLVPGPESEPLRIWDVGLRRLLTYSEDGRSLVQLVRPASWAGVRTPLGVSGPHALVYHHPVSSLGQSELGVVEELGTFSWIEVNSGERLAVERIEENHLYRIYRDEVGVPIVFGIPFKAVPSGVVREGQAWITDGNHPEIRVRDITGDLVRIVRVTGLDRRVTDADLRGHIRVMADGSDERMTFLDEAYEGVPIPEEMAVFSSLLVDDVGLVWAERFDWNPDADVEWVVFDGRGRALGTARTPPGLEVQQIGADFVVGVATDALDIERVERYSLRREPGQPNETPTP